MNVSSQNSGTHPHSFHGAYAEDMEERDYFQSSQISGFWYLSVLEFTKMIVKYHNGIVFRCSSCLQSYCSSECQVRHWPVHVKECHSTSSTQPSRPTSPTAASGQSFTSIMIHSDRQPYPTNIQNKQKNPIKNDRFMCISPQPSRFLLQILQGS